MGFIINDGDKEMPGQKGWSGFASHAFVFGKKPKELGRIVFNNTWGFMSTSQSDLDSLGLNLITYPIVNDGNGDGGNAQKFVGMKRGEFLEDRFNGNIHDIYTYNK